MKLTECKSEHDIFDTQYSTFYSNMMDDLYDSFLDTCSTFIFSFIDETINMKILDSIPPIEAAIYEIN